MDELDEIRKDANTARTLREGVPGSQAGNADLKVRLGGGDPAVGNALRNQPVPDTSEVTSRLNGGGAANQPQMPLRESITRAAAADQPAMDALRDRLTAPQQASTSAVPPRNVPLSNPGGTPIAVDSAGNAGVVRNPSINPAVRGGLSPEADAFLKARNAAPAATEAAAEAAPAAARTISGVARAAGPVGLALGGILEGQDVARVARDPNKSGLDVATQAAESSAKLGGTVAGAALGAQGGAALGAMTGPLAPAAVPVLGLAGGVAGGIIGRKGVEEGISHLRSLFGLDPRPPVATAAAPVPAKPAATPAPAQPAAATPVVAKGGSTPVQPPSNGGSPTIAGVAQQAATKTPVVNYELGKNAVEVIRPGGDAEVHLFGPNGERSSVPSNVFNAGPQSIARYADEVRAAQTRALEDPTGAIAKQRVENEGHLATAQEQSRGMIESSRERARYPQPIAIKDGLGNTTGVATFDGRGGSGGVEFSEVPKPKPARAKALADAKAWIKQGANADAVHAQLKSWYPDLSDNELK